MRKEILVPYSMNLPESLYDWLKEKSDKDRLPISHIIKSILTWERSRERLMGRINSQVFLEFVEGKGWRITRKENV